MLGEQFSEEKTQDSEATQMLKQYLSEEEPGSIKIKAAADYAERQLALVKVSKQSEDFPGQSTPSRIDADNQLRLINARISKRMQKKTGPSYLTFLEAYDIEGTLEHEIKTAYNPPESVAVDTYILRENSIRAGEAMLYDIKGINKTFHGLTPMVLT